MLSEKVLFIKTHSNESEKAEEILKENKVDFYTFVQDSNRKPILIAPSGRSRYDGYEEILEYVVERF